MSLNRQSIVHAFIDTLVVELETLQASYDNAVMGATHEESKPEDPKDMRSTEASYLARGLAERIAEKSALLKRLRHAAQTAPALSASPQSGDIIRLRQESEAGDVSEKIYFLYDGLGGTKVNVNGQTIVAISATAPLGRAICRHAYDEEFQHPTRSDTYLSAQIFL